MRRVVRSVTLAACLLLATAAAPAKPGWPAFVAATIDASLRADPAFAAMSGRHEYDGGLPDWSAAGIAAENARLERVKATATAYDPATLTPAQRLERADLIAIVDGQLFWREEADWPHRNPEYYLSSGLDPAVYVARPYAAPAVRMRAFIAYALAVPRAAAQIHANLKTPLPVSYIDYGVAGFGGLADYYTGDAKAAFAEVKDPVLQARFDVAAKAAAAAMRGLADWLQAQRATATGDYALGPTRFADMLRRTELVDAPLDQVEAAGRAALARDQAALAAACGQYAPGISVRACVDRAAAVKPPEGPVAAARKQLVELRGFIVAHNLVTIPSDELAQVEEAPPYNRQNAAYIDEPGAYDRNLPSVYYIAPPDPAWSAADRAAYIPSEGDLLFTSAHEVWPGHFLNGLHARRVPSMVGRLWYSYAFSEGWAHYCEEMMWDAGLGVGDPRMHIGQLTNALLRDVRLIAAFGLHTHGMTLDQARQLFVEQGYVDEGNARQQAARGTYDPAYLNYTLGKLMIRRLRDDWTATRGGRAAWHDFHDGFLSYGGPPVPLVRAEMMSGAPAAVF